MLHVGASTLTGGDIRPALQLRATPISPNGRSCTVMIDQLTPQSRLPTVTSTMNHHTYPVFDNLAPPSTSVEADKAALQSEPRPSLLKLPPDILRATASYLNAADAVSLALSASGLQDAGECRAWKSLVLHARDPDLP